MDTIAETGRMIPITEKVDVLIAGGGTAGMVAGIAAARNGAKTLIVERNSCLGGMCTAGLVVQFGGGGYRYMTGIMKEILDELIKRNAAVDLGFPDVNFPFDPEVMKQMAFDMAHEAGAEMLLYTMVVGTIVDNNLVKGVIIENKSGRQAILADVVVDATGDADVAVSAGVPYEKTNTGVTIPFRVGNVDFNKLIDYMKKNPDQFYENDPNLPLIRCHGFFDMIKEAKERGELDPSIGRGPAYEGKSGRDYIRLEGMFVEKKMTMVNSVTILNGYTTSAEDHTRAELEVRRKNWQVYNFLKKHVPGFESCYYIDTASNLGVHESRRIIGDYELTKMDIQSGRKFKDTVVKAHGNLDHRTLHIKAVTFDIPYRCLIAKRINNLLAAGRCISIPFEAMYMSLSLPLCMQIGEAVGTAAALAATKKISVRNLNIQELQMRLKNQGLLP